MAIFEEGGPFGIEDSLWTKQPLPVKDEFLNEEEPGYGTNWKRKSHKHEWRHKAFMPKGNDVCEILVCDYCSKNVYRTISELGDTE